MYPALIENSAARPPSRVVARRRDLLAATLRVVARKGLSGITVNDVATEAGCSYGVVLFHFGTKERLLLAALDTLRAEYEALWLEPEPEPDAAHRLLRMIGTDFDPEIANPDTLAVWVAFWAEASRNPAYRDTCSALKRRYADEVARLVAVLAGRWGGAANPLDIAESLYALTDGFWVRAQVTGENDAADRARRVALCRAFLALHFPSDPAFAPDPAGRSAPTATPVR